MSKKPKSAIKLLSYADDQPHDGRGLLIPIPGQRRSVFTPQSVKQSKISSVTRGLIIGLSVFVFIFLGITGYGLVAKSNLAALPAVTVVDPYSHRSAPLNYGPEPALAEAVVYDDTRDELINAAITFVDVDLNKRQLHFFKNGVLVQSAEVLAIGETGSWWDTPSGLYKVENKEKRKFSYIGQVYLPWLITFGGNYVIHGWPLLADDEPALPEIKVGGVRLSSQSAKLLFDQVTVGMPILVHHQTAKPQEDNFVYEPSVTDVSAAEYMVVDLDNETILAAKDITKTAPIASLTKLMTAVVASEKLDLDGRIKVTSPTFVTSLIPRLSGRASVSTYSLMQLLLVESSNEAAEVLAGEVGREKFISAMNTKARQLGMLHTAFADPSGLSADNVSTVSDLYKLVRYIYQKKRFIFDLTNKETVFDSRVGGEFSDLINFNPIEDAEGFVGGKVGETIAAGQTSVSLHKIKIKGQQRLIAVILLGSDSRADDVLNLLSYVKNRFAH